MAKYRKTIGGAVNVFKALGDESRLRALLALERSELCVCQIVELLELAPSTVSKHMSVLKQAGLVESSKHGRWVYFRIAGDGAPGESKPAVEYIIAALERHGAALGLDWDERVRHDRKRLDKILKTEPEELCRRQCAC